ncbi:MAG: carotenoid 1,2-hydratase [Deltaproteobacteria bacterium]|nr:carotenoid 1,2-hydratase [Deltaproteobacteria bacterium]
MPGRTISFPRDHFSHPDFKTEWWYYTGHLETEGGKKYGYQVTFFRFGLRDRQKQEKDKAPLFTELYLAHFALSDKQEKKFLFRERANRGYRDKAGAAVDRYLVWNEEWKIEGSRQSHIMEIKDRDVALKLYLTPLKPPVLHGDRGLSQKGEGKGKASYYYSFTRMKTEGEFEIGGKRERVRGLSWMDHEFGSNQLGENQVGWDWFSIQLDNKTEIMLYLMRRRDGSPDPYSSGTLIYQDGSTRHLTLDDFRVEVLERWKSVKSSGNYPMRWRVTVPSEQIELEIAPFFREQELDTRKSTRVTYWEGSVEVRGSYKKRPIQGLGYVEMTGYAGRLKV